MTAKEIAIGVDGYVAEVLNEYKKYMETEGAKYADMYTRGEDYCYAPECPSHRCAPKHLVDAWFDVTVDFVHKSWMKSTGCFASWEFSGDVAQKLMCETYDMWHNL